MGMIPVNVARISQNLRGFHLLNSVRRNQVDMFKTETQLATGLRFQAPSEDASSASAVTILDRHLDRINQVKKNLDTVNSTINATNTAMADAITLIREAKDLAVEAANDVLGEDERNSLVTVINAMIDDAMAIGNRQYLNNFLFSGSVSGKSPFELGLNGIIYNGDEDQRQTIIDTDFSQDSFTISGMEFFGAVSTPVSGIVDLNPALTNSTRIQDLRTPAGEIPALGRIQVNDGNESTTIDLGTAATVGDIIDILNAQMPATLTAEVDGGAIRIAGSNTITITDAGGGNAARSLGIMSENPVNQIVGYDLDPVLNPRTTLASLNNGTGLDVSAGITINNGDGSATLTFDNAETLEDVLNEINTAGIGAWAKISDDGKSIDIYSRVSGTDLSVTENGGTVATDLGIRTIATNTKLENLSLARGVHTSPGDDVRITTADGTELTFNMDDARTIQDVLDLFNASGNITADLDPNGNGIRIVDNTAGAGTLTAESIDNSSVLAELGLNVESANGELVGNDVNPVRTESLFTTLLELRDGLEQNNTQLLTFAGERLDRVLDHMTRVQGEMAARSKSMDARVSLLESEEYSTTIMKSDIQDVDLTEAIVQFQQMQTALQANLSTSSKVMNLSLIDYL